MCFQSDSDKVSFAASPLPPLLLLRFCRPADSISFDMSLPSNEEGKRLLSAEAISLGGRTDAGATPGPSEVRCPSHHRRSPHPLRPLFVPLAPWAAAGVTSPSKPGSRRDIPFLLKPLSPSPRSLLYSPACRDCSRGLGRLFKTCIKNGDSHYTQIKFLQRYCKVTNTRISVSLCFLAGGHHFRLSRETLPESLRSRLSRHGAKQGVPTGEGPSKEEY